MGQAAAQGAGRQARQVLASNPVERPPDEEIRMPAVSHDRYLWTNRAQAREHEWQPMHLSIRGAVKIFMVDSHSFILGACLGMALYGQSKTP